MHKLFLLLLVFPIFSCRASAQVIPFTSPDGLGTFAVLAPEGKGGAGNFSAARGPTALKPR
jgi:hypothetical protein